MKPNVLLGVNVDHVATIRQARYTTYPDPVEAAKLALQSGADFITIHVREDRRHVQEDDLARLSELEGVRINLEMALTDEMLEMALKYKPQDVCLVPEKREELTTEGGLDVVRYQQRTQAVCQALVQAGIQTSLFIEANEAHIQTAKAVGADVIELHTGAYAELSGEAQNQELVKIAKGIELGNDLGLQVNAGHGLHYDNVHAMMQLGGLKELNIGHGIVARALIVGFAQAVAEMRALMDEASQA